MDDGPNTDIGCDFVDAFYNQTYWEPGLDVPPWAPLPPRDLLTYSVLCGRIQRDCAPDQHAGGITSSHVPEARRAGADVRIVSGWSSAFDHFNPHVQADLDVLGDLFRTTQLDSAHPVLPLWLFLDCEGRPIPYSNLEIAVPRTSLVSSVTHTGPRDFTVRQLLLHWEVAAMVRFDELEFARLTRFNSGVFLHWVRRQYAARTGRDAAAAFPYPDRRLAGTVPIMLMRDVCDPRHERFALVNSIPDPRDQRRVRY